MERGELKERMNLLSQEAEKRKRLSRLKKDTLRKATFLKKKATIEPRDVYHLIKGFFKEFLEKPYEFTIQELRSELKKVYISNTTRKDISDIFNTLHIIEYKNADYTHEDLVKLLGDFTLVVQQLVHTHTRPKSIIARMRAFLFKEELEPDVIIAELPVIESDDHEHIRIHTLTEKCYLALDKHNFRRAKASYQALLAEYAELSDDEKESYYPLIDQTYQDIVNRSAKKNS